MIAYFDDGSVANCPRCEPLMSNIKAMERATPTDRWNVNNPASILEGTDDSEWIIFDYQWKQKISND